MKEQFNWYLKNLFTSLFFPLFLFVLFFVYVNGLPINASWVGCAPCEMPSEWSKGYFDGVMPIGDIEMLFIAYVVISLYTYPFESGISLFEFSLPFSRTQNFISKYFAGLFYISFTIIFSKVISIYVITNYVFGTLDSVFYAYIFSSVFTLLYFYSIFMFFSVIFKKSIGVIFSIVGIIALNEYVIFPLRIPLPPTIYLKPIHSLILFFNALGWTIAIGVAMSVLSYVLYRRVEV